MIAEGQVALRHHHKERRSGEGEADHDPEAFPGGDVLRSMPAFFRWTRDNTACRKSVDQASSNLLRFGRWPMHPWQPQDQARQPFDRFLPRHG